MNPEKTEFIIYQSADGLVKIDGIIAVGCRVKSARFAMNDAPLKQVGGGLYWKKRLERNRDTRASEKVMYRQVFAGGAA
ncbi:hypothetical protein M2447_002044 [Ereboglobus sp. PH5-10]|nr:hypothetical protein [Ereboglobus sp. PH5-10]MDF9827939.1 hypothetical protein [Ereboglobus sp. PH5-10]